MHFDDALQEVGDTGAYQIGVYFMIATMEFLAADAIQMNFMGYNMPHWCRVPRLDNFTYTQQKYIAIPDAEECKTFDLPWDSYTDEELLNWDRSNRTANVTDFVSCSNGWVYDQSEFVSTVNSEYDLVCGQDWKVELISTIYMAGRLVGAVTCGLVSDRYGRRITALSYQGIKIIGAMIACFVPYYEGFVFGRCLLAVGSTGSNLATYVLLSELVGKKYRGIYGVSWNLMFSFGSCAIPGIAFWIRDYLKLQHAFAWPNFVMAAYFFCLDESPRWLAAQGRDDEAIAILQKMAQVNRKPPLSNDVHFNEERVKVSQMKAAQTGSILDLFRTPNMRRKMLILSLTWFTGSMLFYGLSLNSGRLPGDVFINTFLLSAVEALGNVCCMFLIDRLGRRRTVGGFMLIGGVLTLGCIPFLIFEEYETGATVLSVMGKGFVTVSFTGVYILTSEIMPTSVRSIGVGVGSMCARIAGMAAPYVGGPLGDVEVYLPSLIFCVLAFVSGSLVFLLPETLGQNLPDTIQEAEKFGKKKATVVPLEQHVEEGNSTEEQSNTEMSQNLPDTTQRSEELGNEEAKVVPLDALVEEGAEEQPNAEISQNLPYTIQQSEELGNGNVTATTQNQIAEVSSAEDEEERTVM